MPAFHQAGWASRMQVIADPVGRIIRHQNYPVKSFKNLFLSISLDFYILAKFPVAHGLKSITGVWVLKQECSFPP
jgi:hypothetical protein